MEVARKDRFELPTTALQGACSTVGATYANKAEKKRWTMSHARAMTNRVPKKMMKRRPTMALMRKSRSGIDDGEVTRMVVWPLLPYGIKGHRLTGFHLPCNPPKWQEQEDSDLRRIV